jgi:hypothetical protein
MVQGRPVVVRGWGLYEQDPNLGSVLRICVAEGSGGFELVLAESHWTGIVESGHALGCDYLLHL